MKYPKDCLSKIAGQVHLVCISKCTLRHIFILKFLSWNHGNGSKDKKMTEKNQVGQEPLVNQKKFMIESIFTFNLFLLGFVRHRVHVHIALWKI